MRPRSFRTRTAFLPLSLLMVALLSACSSGRPSTDLLDRVIREDCCWPVISETLYLSDGTELQVEGIRLMHPLTNRGVVGHGQFISGYCDDREIKYEGVLRWPDERHSTPEILTHVRQTRRNTYYLERPVTVSVSDTRIEYRSDRNSPWVEYPGLEYVTTSEQRIYKVILDVETCNVTFEPAVQHTEYITTWVEFDDRWAVYVDTPKGSNFWREISKR